MENRDAVLADAPAACDVLRRSIVELCAADHNGDPAILERWLANKTPEIIAGWIADPGSSMLLAVEQDAIVAVGGVTNAGEITLLYASPDARFRGISRALLAALEARAATRGNTSCTLVSTATARRFYVSAGYVETGPPQHKFGSTGGYPMARDLLCLTRVGGDLPVGFATLGDEARAEGYRFLDRLASDWAGGVMRFSEPGECLLFAHSGQVPAAIGGLTQDPVLSATLRMRRFYVRLLFRRRGVGQRLAQALLDAARRDGRPVVVNASPASFAFWEARGFVADARDGHTHTLATIT